MYLRDAMATKNNPPKKKRLRKRTLVSHLMSCALLSLWEAFIYIYSNTKSRLQFIAIQSSSKRSSFLSLSLSFWCRRKLVNRRLILVLGLFLLSGITQAQGRKRRRKNVVYFQLKNIIIAFSINWLVRLATNNAAAH